MTTRGRTFWVSLSLSLLFLFAPVRDLTSRLLMRTVYAPILTTEAWWAEMLTLRQQYRKWLRAWVALNPEIQQRAWAHLDSLWQLPQTDRTGVVARILAFDPMGVPTQILLNQGALAGVRYGSAVIDAQGLVGKVTRVSPRQSWVSTVYHPDFRAGVVVKRSGVLGVLHGGWPPTVHYMPAWADVRPGDTLWTSGIGDLIPPGLFVGVVVTVDTLETNPFFLKLSCRPAYDFSRTGVVLVLPRVEAGEDLADTLQPQPLKVGPLREESKDRSTTSR